MNQQRVGEHPRERQKGIALGAGERVAAAQRDPQRVGGEPVQMVEAPLTVLPAA